MKKNKESKIKQILYELSEGEFFDKGKTVLDVIRKLSQRGFTVRGKKIGMVARMLTQMCQDSTTGLERDEIPEEEKERGEKWIFKKSKKENHE